MPHAVFDGPLNMAEDARLLDRAESGEPGWRVYGWTGPWVSLGCFQRPETALIDPAAIPWVMRPTGGKAVLHGHDVTVGLALPLDLLAAVSEEPTERLARSLRTVYRLAIRPIVEAMRACGMPAILAADRIAPSPFSRSEKGEGVGGEGPRAIGLADCFAATSPNDVIHEALGVKVCGCALKLTQRAVLVQASLPAGPPLVDPHEVFERPSQPPSIPWKAEGFGAAFGEAVDRHIALRAR